MCIEWRRYDNGDWDWQYSVPHRGVSHGGDYRLYELTQFIDGTPWNVPVVPYKNERLYRALLAGIEEQHMPYNLGDLEEIMDSNANFYTLTTNEIWYYWGEWM